MLKIKNRLKKRKEFAYVYKKGIRLNSKDLGLYYVKSKLPFVRFGLTVSTKIGNAVVRNKIKRQLRAILYEYVEKIHNYNIILVAHPSITESNFQDIKAQINKLFYKGNFVNE